MNNEPLLQEDPETEEPEVQPEKKKDGVLSTVFDIVEMFAWSVFAVLIIFSFAFRL